MHPILWYALTLLAAVVYGIRIKRRIGFVPTPLWHWRTALVLCVGVCLGAVLVARTPVDIHRDVGIGLHSVIITICVWLSLRYWFSGYRWDVATGLVAITFLGLYLAYPGRLNNLILLCVSLGISVGGYYGTKMWLRILLSALCLFDIYATWFSDIMNSVIQKNPGAFPVTFSMLALPVLEIGTLDVVLSALAVVAIQRHRGVVRSVAFAIACLGTLAAIPFAAQVSPKWFGQVPFLIVIAPMAIVSLDAFRSKKA